MTEIIKYEDDFHGWAMSTAALLREKRYDQVDYNHIIEELECMGASERRELINRLAQLIFHLLKWQYQPQFRSRSWSASVDEQRLKLAQLFDENPGLKGRAGDFIPKGYKQSLALMRKETPLERKDLPPQCPYSIEELVDEEYYPK